MRQGIDRGHLQAELEGRGIQATPQRMRIAELLFARDERGDEVLEETFRHDGGITEFCDFLAPDEPVTDVIRLQGDDSFTETVLFQIAVSAPPD